MKHEHGEVDSLATPHAPWRSRPGVGEQVGLYLVDLGAIDAGWTGPDSGLVASVAEDFAVTHWPVVVKVKLGLTQADIVRALRTLANAVEGGFYMTRDAFEEDIGRAFRVMERPLGP